MPEPPIHGITIAVAPSASSTHQISRIICKYVGVLQASIQAYISVSTQLGNKGEVVSIKAIMAQAIASITYTSK